MSETKTVWHMYPDETPPEDNATYLVTMSCLSRWHEFPIFGMATMVWRNNSWQGVYIGYRVHAWAELPELPEPYQPQPYKPTP